MDSIIFEPGRPQRPQSRVQPKPGRSLDAISLIKTFLRALPKGEEDWDDKRPHTQAEINDLRYELTLHKIPRQERAGMRPRELLQAFAVEHAALLKEAKSQIHMLAFIALGEVAVGLGLRPKEVNATVAEYTGVSESAVRTMRLGVRRWIKASDVLRRTWLSRVDELPFRRTNFIHTIKKLSDENIGILGEVRIEEEYAVFDDVRVYIPRKQLSSDSLRLPDIIYELYGGKFSLIEIERYLDVPGTVTNPDKSDHPLVTHDMMATMKKSAP
ncbi:hypothetical protein CEP51_015359 [Fusarium floridanum]|uniref:Uncharacterized protein n=1 Tax=Fusarium floridanum TaxID=1325733 RepID=A0A428PBF1_9HYPO|nr:hypothetical protein CEP51_015359 [Fusarium floridanum]